MLQIGDIVDECKVLSIDKVKRVFDKNGISKGWVKQYSLQCKNDHTFTASFSLANKVLEGNRHFNCPECKKIEREKLKEIEKKKLEKQKQLRFEEKSLKNNRPDLEKYFLYKEDFLNNTTGSRKKVKMICPVCGFIKKNMISNLNYFGFSCDFCSENKSIGERFFSEILRFNKIEFVFEKSFDWSDRKRYDFYLPKYNMIIETHGIQHYNQGFSNLNGRTLKEEQENDTYKMNLAMDNGIHKYIILDFRNSDFEYMISSIKKHNELLNIFSEKTNYLLCYENALSVKSNFIKTIELFNDFYKEDNSPENFHVYIKNICKILGITKTTVQNYLNKGSKVGLCEYDGLASQKSYKRHNQRSVYCKELDITFSSTAKCAEYFECTPGTIQNYIDNKNKKRTKYKKKYTLIAV